MTLAIAWVRELEDYQELIFCSDSRLRFGCAWDACQKIFPLPRGDCAITFAGDTQFAYPFVHSAINAVSLHRGSNNRQVDVTEAKGFLLKAINSMLRHIKDFCKGQESFDEPILQMIFGGYSWKKKRFVFWKFFFHPGQREFHCIEARGWKGMGAAGKLIIIGDPVASHSAVKRSRRQNTIPPNPDEDVEKKAKDKFFELLKYRKEDETAGLNMEPFEVLRDLIREEISPYIGGSPQLVKVYQHMNVQSFGVRWPYSPDGNVAVLGRILDSGEKVHIPILNPDTFEIERSKQN